jgi:hypothetical protein
MRDKHPVRGWIQSGIPEKLESGGNPEIWGQKWAFENIWLFIPVQGKIGSFLRTIPDYPFHPGNSLSATGINYSLIERVRATKQVTTERVLDG